jgi:hypothetical protein
VQRCSVTRTHLTGQQPDRPTPRGVDYDRYYCALDLLPGAPLEEIEDRLRLLRVAFNSDALPSGLKSQVKERSDRVEQAAHELFHHWASHGKAPPSADLSGAEDLLDALVEVLAGNGVDEAELRHGAHGTPTSGAAPGAAGRQKNGADLQGKDAETGAALDRRATAGTAPSGPPASASGNTIGGDSDSGLAPSARIEHPVALRAEPDGREISEPARPQWAALLGPAQAPCFPGANQRIFLNRPEPDPGVHRIEITLQLVHRHILVQQDRVRPPIGQRPLPIIAGPTATAPKCTSGNLAIASASEPQRRRHLPTTGSLLLKMGIFGIAIVIAAWLQLYNLDPAVPRSGSADGTIPAPPLSIQMGFEANTPRPTGAFAQPAGRNSNPGGAFGWPSR